MKAENSVLMRQARESLKGKWGLAIGTFVIYGLINAAIACFKDIGWILSLIVSGPLAVGISSFTLSISRNGESRLKQLFGGFPMFGKSLAAYLLVTLFTLLWTLLLIIPGIVAGIAYSQTFYIVADDGSIGARDAIKKSKTMMYGYKWKYFCLQLRFLGWVVLSVLTLGIGFLWLFPYMQVSLAAFYNDIKG